MQKCDVTQKGYSQLKKKEYLCVYNSYFVKQDYICKQTKI